MKIGQKAICTRNNGDKFTIRIVDKDYDSIMVLILDGDNKGKISFLFISEIDDSIEWL